MTIGENIRKFRVQCNLTQKELGKLIGTTQQMIAQYENNQRKPKIETLAKIAQALHTSVDVLSNNMYFYGTDTISVYDLIDDYPDKETKTGLTEKNKRDIKKDLDSLREKLENKELGPAAYDGEDIPDEDVDLFLGQVELMLRRLKLKNKEKYTPKKYTVDQQTTMAEEAPAAPDQDAAEAANPDQDTKK